MGAYKLVNHDPLSDFLLGAWALKRPQRAKIASLAGCSCSLPLGWERSMLAVPPHIAWRPWFRCCRSAICWMLVWSRWLMQLCGDFILVRLVRSVFYLRLGTHNTLIHTRSIKNKDPFGNNLSWIINWTLRLYEFSQKPGRWVCLDMQITLLRQKRQPHNGLSRDYKINPIAPASSFNIWVNSCSTPWISTCY